MTTRQDVEQRGLWRDLSALGAGVPFANGPADVLAGRGPEEYARWLAWLIRACGDAAQVLPLLGLNSPGATGLCAGARAEALPVGAWILVRFPARAFIGVRLGGADPAPALIERAAGTGIPLWRTRLTAQPAWNELADRTAALAPWLAQNRGWAAAGIAEHFAHCLRRDAATLA